MQDVTWTKATWWSDDQHLKQDLRSTREDLRYQAKSKHEDRNQAARKIAKKRAHNSDRTLTKSNRTLRSEARQQQQRPNAGPDDGGKPTGCRTTAFDRVQRGSRAVNLRPDASGGKWPDAGSVRSVVRSSNGRDDRTRPIRTTPASG